MLSVGEAMPFAGGRRIVATATRTAFAPGWYGGGPLA
jgi:hypothetical protein